MNSGEIIAIVIASLVVIGAVFYIIKAKKSGKKCIGCSESSCNGGCASCTACARGASPENEEKEEN